MLAPPDKFRCVECGKPYGTDGFAFYEGNPDHGPAYFSDHGVLCSIECSLAHTRRRDEEGTRPRMPVRNPLTGEIG